MLTFKLSRRGKTKQPTYRLVVVDKKKDPWGMIKEDVGSYNPHNKKAQFKVERIKFWISKGAQPSASVHNLLVKEKVLEAPKKKIKIKKKKGATAETPKVSETPSSQEKAETPKIEEVKPEVPKAEEPKLEAPKSEASTPVS